MNQIGSFWMMDGAKIYEKLEAEYKIGIYTGKGPPTE